MFIDALNEVKQNEKNKEEKEKELREEEERVNNLYAQIQ